MKMTRRGMIAAIAGLAAAAQAAEPAARPIRFILPNAVGSGVDALVRAAQPALATSLGVPIVVENQPGAGGIVGLQGLARSAADGTTLSVVSNNVVIFPSVMKSLPFRMPDDFTPIAMIGSTPLVLVVNPTRVSARTCREFVAQLKSSRGTLDYGSGGIGTILHLTGAMFLDQAGAQANHVPYKGVGPLVTDLIGGQIDFAVVALPSVRASIGAGKLHAIGVGTSQRLPAAPEIPTFVEQGLPDYVVEAWFGLLGPRGMAPNDVRRTHAAVVAAFEDPAVRKAMDQQGNTIHIGTPEQAAAMFRSELAKYASIVHKLGIEPV